MTEPPERSKPPKLTPGEPLWGTSSISSPGSTPSSAAPERPPAGERRARVAGSARPPERPAAPATYGSPATAPPAPAPGTYGQPPGYRSPGGPGREPADRPTGRGVSTSVLLVTAVVCFLLGAVTGFGLAWLL